MVYCWLYLDRVVDVGGEALRFVDSSSARLKDGPVFVSVRVSFWNERGWESIFIS